MARYSLRGDETVVPYDYSKSQVCSPCYWYTGTKEDDTPRMVAKKTNTNVFDILFLNKVLYGGDGFTASARLRKGTPLRLPGRDPKAQAAQVQVQARQSQIVTSRPFFSKWRKSGFEMCFDIGSQHHGCWGQNTSPYAQGCDLS